MIFFKDLPLICRHFIKNNEKKKKRGGGREFTLLFHRICRHHEHNRWIFSVCRKAFK